MGELVDFQYYFSEFHNMEKSTGYTEPEFIKCEICGAVGNWKEFIKAGLCHKKKRSVNRRSS